MRVLAPSSPPTIVTSFHSKISASHYEWDMYDPFTEALNYALGRLSDVEVDGLPEFKSHIAFVLCNKGVSSDRDLAGSSFKPDIALMSIQDARELYGLDKVDTPDVSGFVGEIAEKTISGSPDWGTMLSAVEVKRKKNISGWAKLEVFGHQDGQVSVIRDADQRLDEKLDDSQPTTREINLLPYE